MQEFRIGLVINPLAGIGGAVGLKGSDGDDIVAKALSMGAEKRAPHRVAQVLEHLQPYKKEILIITAPGEMGEDLCAQQGFNYEVVGQLNNKNQTTAIDTECCSKAIVERSVKLLVFAGGDGTARNIVNSVPANQLCLGVPAGVKIHSGVYAVNVHGAVEIIEQLIKGELVSVADSEVRDIDEEAFRKGVVQAKFYGELLTPVEHRYLQHVKCGGREIEELVLQDIAEYLIEQMDDETLYIVGPGTTTRALMDVLGLENTLLGIDVIQGRQLIANDVGEQQLLELLRKSKQAKIVVTPIGGQGHILGRGNHQISPAVIRQVGLENLIVISPKSKLLELDGRPLLVDTYDESLNQSLSGITEVVTGYEDRIAYRISY